MRQKSTPYNSFWDLRQDRSVFIKSTEGQVQFFLSYTQNAFRKPGWFEIAETEYREMYPRQEQQESHGLRMTGL